MVLCVCKGWMGNTTHHKSIQSSNGGSCYKAFQGLCDCVQGRSDFLPERCHHLVIGEILVIVMVDGVTTRLSIGSASVLVPIKPKFQVFCKRHGPGLIGKGNNWCYLKFNINRLLSNHILRISFFQIMNFFF